MVTRDRVAGLAVAAMFAVMLPGCAAADAGPAPLTQAELDAVFDGVDVEQGSTVGDALELARQGTIGFIDVRIAAGVGQEEMVFPGAPPDDVLDWAVVGLCGYADTIPSVEVAAVPAEDADAVVPFNLVCDGAPAPPEE